MLSNIFTENTKLCSLGFPFIAITMQQLTEGKLGTALKLGGLAAAAGLGGAALGHPGGLSGVMDTIGTHAQNLGNTVSDTVNSAKDTVSGWFNGDQAPAKTGGEYNASLTDEQTRAEIDAATQKGSVNTPEGASGGGGGTEVGGRVSTGAESAKIVADKAGTGDTSGSPTANESRAAQKFSADLNQEFQLNPPNTPAPPPPSASVPSAIPASSGSLHMHTGEAMNQLGSGGQNSADLMNQARAGANNNGSRLIGSMVRQASNAAQKLSGPAGTPRTPVTTPTPV